MPGVVRVTTTPASFRGGVLAAATSKVNVMAMASLSKIGRDNATTANINIPQTTTTTTTTFVASSMLASLALSALPALADLDADGVETPNIITSIFFTIAVLLLGVCTLGIIYLAAREVRRRHSKGILRGRGENHF